MLGGLGLYTEVERMECQGGGYARGGGTNCGGWGWVIFMDFTGC